MLDINVNIISVLLASLVSIVFSSCWYGFLFGRLWLKAMNISKNDITERKIDYAITVLLTIIISYGIGAFLSLVDSKAILDSLVAVFLLWFCFVLPANMLSVLWSGKGREVFLLDIGNYFFTMQLAGIVITLIK